MRNLLGQVESMGRELGLSLHLARPVGLDQVRLDVLHLARRAGGFGDSDRLLVLEAYIRGLVNGVRQGGGGQAGDGS